MSFPTVTIHLNGCPCQTEVSAQCTCSSGTGQSTNPAQIPNPSIPCVNETECDDPVGPDCVLWDGIERPEYGIVKGASLRQIIMRLVNEIDILKQP